MATDCIFCSIVQGVSPAERIFENEALFVIPDLNPKAPIHLLVIPKEHIPSLVQTTGQQDQLLGQLLAAARVVAASRGLDTSGYKVVLNVGQAGGQVIPHLHLHVLGGQDVSGVT